MTTATQLSIPKARSTAKRSLSAKHRMLAEMAIWANQQSSQYKIWFASLAEIEQLEEWKSSRKFDGVASDLPSGTYCPHCDARPCYDHQGGVCIKHFGGNYHDGLRVVREMEEQ